jgi:hypothetical protein
MSFSVVVGTYGAQSWVRLAERRAIPSAQAQDVPVIHVHDETLAASRNAGLARVETEFVIHLDADDELSPSYVDAMRKGTADLRAASRLDIGFGGRAMGVPYMPRVWGHEHECTGECLRFGNWILIGAAVRTDLVRSVGGWWEEGWSEDWSLWARCWKAGGTVEALPEAVYRAHRSRHSRNRVSRSVGLHWHREIERAVWPEEIPLA